MNKSESKYFNTAQLKDEALIALLKKKDFEFITVKEICEKAGVNRSTFYLHYENLSDLLAETTEMINKRFQEGYKKTFIDVSMGSVDDVFLITPEYIKPYLNFVKENKELFKLIHEKPQLFNNQKAFEKLYAELFTYILDKFGVDEKEKPYIFAFYTQGVLAVVMKWVNQGCKEDVDFIMEMITGVVGYSPRGN